MPKCFKPADEEVMDLLQRALRSYHPSLVQENVVIRVVMVEPDKDPETLMPKAPALTVGGFPVLAKVKLASGTERAAGGYDVVISINDWRWEQLEEAHKLACLDHELEHVVLDVDRDGLTKRTETGRAKLRTRPDDYMINGFDSVAQRHGQNSIEVLQLRGTALSHQLVFDFLKDEEPKKRRRRKAG